MAMQADPVSEKFRQWATRKALVEFETSQMNRLRDELMEIVIARGDQDEKGNTHFSLSESVIVGDKEFKGIKREARTITTLNKERAIDLARTKGLHKVVVLVPEVDQDELYAAYQRGEISEEEVDDCFDVKKTFAFKSVAA